MAKQLPAGYIAQGNTTALDSSVLAQNGEVHANYTGQGARNGERLLGLRGEDAMDSFVEFSIQGDPRLEALREYARGLRGRYADPQSPEYIADTKQREKTITDSLMPKVYETYGSYSEDTRKNGSAAENGSLGVFVDSTVYLKDMEKDSLVCRHYAPVVSVLLDDAGVPNDLVTSSGIQNVAKRNGAYDLVPSDNNEGHMYIVTRQGGAVVEATAASEYADGRNGGAYKPIVNGVKAKDIVYFGHSALTDHLAYGGHTGNGSWGKDGVEKARAASVQRYNQKEEIRYQNASRNDAITSAFARLERAEESRDPQAIESARAAFIIRAMDMDGDYRLTRKDLDAIDLNRDGVLDADERGRLLEGLPPAISARLDKELAVVQQESGIKDMNDPRLLTVLSEQRKGITITQPAGPRQEQPVPAPPLPPEPAAKPEPKMRDAGTKRDEALRTTADGVRETMGSDILQRQEARRQFLAVLMDVDGDGKFTKKDLAAIDKDGDGTISREEIKQFSESLPKDVARLAGRAMVMLGRQSGTDIQQTNNLVEALERYGVKLEDNAPAEALAAEKRQEALRTATDGVREAMGADLQQRREAGTQFLATLMDVDGDGKFTQKDLAAIDKDGDGRISREEVKQLRESLPEDVARLADRAMGMLGRQSGTDIGQTDNLVKALEQRGIKLETDEKATSPMDDKMRLALAQANDPSFKVDVGGGTVPGKQRQQGRGTSVP